MTDKEIQILVILLHKYQAELLENYNDKKTDHIGIKAQYDHARKIANKLDVRINNSIKGWYIC